MSETVAIAQTGKYFKAVSRPASASTTLSATPAPQSSLNGYFSFGTFASTIRQSGRTSGQSWWSVTITSIPLDFIYSTSA